MATVLCTLRVRGSTRITWRSLTKARISTLWERENCYLLRLPVHLNGIRQEVLWVSPPADNWVPPSKTISVWNFIIREPSSMKGIFTEIGSRPMLPACYLSTRENSMQTDWRHPTSHFYSGMNVMPISKNLSWTTKVYWPFLRTALSSAKIFPW